MRLMIVLIGVCLLLAGTTYWFWRQNKVLKTEKYQAIQLHLAAKKSVKRYINEYNHATARIQVLELTVRNAEDLAASEQLRPVRQFRGVKRDLRNVEAFTTVDAELNLEFPLPELPKLAFPSDSLNTVSIENDTLKIHSRIPLEGALLWHRKWFLGRRYWTFDVSCVNKQVTIEGLQYIRIGKR